MIKWEIWLVSHITVLFPVSDRTHTMTANETDRVHGSQVQVSSPSLPPSIDVGRKGRRREGTGAVDAVHHLQSPPLNSPQIKNAHTHKSKKGAENTNQKRMKTVRKVGMERERVAKAVVCTPIFL